MSPTEYNASTDQKKYIELDPNHKTEIAENFLDLGLMYSTGQFGEPDLITAHSLFNLAAIGGNAVAKEYRQQLSAELTAQDMARAQRLARDWIECS